MESLQIFELIKKHPETYKSILKDNYGRNSLTIELKRKIYQGIKHGILHRTSLNGSRGSKCLITHKNKKHSIVIELQHLEFNYYCCEKIEYDNDKILKLIKVEKLENDLWKKIPNCEIYSGNILKVI
jgi:uncharacterized protein YlaN (UPF0358 family)